MTIEMWEVLVPEWPGEGEQVEHCLVYENTSAQTGKDTKWVDGRDSWWADMVPKQKVELPALQNCCPACSTVHPVNQCPIPLSDCI